MSILMITIFPDKKDSKSGSRSWPEGKGLSVSGGADRQSGWSVKWKTNWSNAPSQSRSESGPRTRSSSGTGRK